MAMNLGADGKTGFFAVFDGHGGKEVAKYVAIYMVSEMGGVHTNPRGFGALPIDSAHQNAHPDSKPHVVPTLQCVYCVTYRATALEGGCAPTQAQELVRTEGWSGGDLQSALTQVLTVHAAAESPTHHHCCARRCTYAAAAHNRRTSPVRAAVVKHVTHPHLNCWFSEWQRGCGHPRVRT